MGAWVAEHQGQRTEERWVWPHPSLLLGTNRTFKGGEEVAREHLQVDLRGGRAIYRAWPHNQPPASFTLREVKAQAALFADPTHDFPRRIRYRRHGEVLEARIAGQVQGKDRAAAWTFKRVAAPPAPPAALKKEVTIKAAAAEVWRAWTTPEGVKTFFAPQARIVLERGGAYELYFNLSAPAGQRGGEGCTLIEIAAPSRLAFTWNFPPTLPAIRTAHTLITVELAPAGEGATRVTLTQRGWRAGPQWSKGRVYFDRAWGLVLSRLKQRFEQGPVDWSKL